MPRPRVPGADAEDLIARLDQAFMDGDPAGAFAASRDVSQALRTMVVEAARLRFRVNFGTSACDRCNGLTAGPGVIATCFQLRECHYDNVREDSSGGRQRRFLDLLESFSKMGP